MKSVCAKAALCVATLALSVPTAALSQSAQNCAPREKVLLRLAERYGETRQSIGLAPNNSVVEVFASPESGSWTITVTSASGLTCLMASGQAFEMLAKALPAKDKDA